MDEKTTIGHVKIDLLARVGDSEPQHIGTVNAPLVVRTLGAAREKQATVHFGDAFEAVSETVKRVFEEGPRTKVDPPNPERARRLCYGFDHLVSGLDGGGRRAHDHDSVDHGREVIEGLAPINSEDVVRLASHVADEYAHVGVHHPDAPWPPEHAVEAFKRAWHAADESGPLPEGERTKAGLTAALDAMGVTR
jgi:hypothetical protein